MICSAFSDNESRFLFLPGVDHWVAAYIDEKGCRGCLKILKSENPRRPVRSDKGVSSAELEKSGCPRATVLNSSPL